MCLHKTGHLADNTFQMGTFLWQWMLKQKLQMVMWTHVFLWHIDQMDMNICCSFDLSRTPERRMHRQHFSRQHNSVPNPNHFTRSPNEWSKKFNFCAQFFFCFANFPTAELSCSFNMETQKHTHLAQISLGFMAIAHLFTSWVPVQSNSKMWNHLLPMRMFGGCTLPWTRLHHQWTLENVSVSCCVKLPPFWHKLQTTLSQQPKRTQRLVHNSVHWVLQWHWWPHNVFIALISEQNWTAKAIFITCLCNECHTMSITMYGIQMLERDLVIFHVAAPCALDTCVWVFPH